MVLDQRAPVKLRVKIQATVQADDVANLVAPAQLTEELQREQEFLSTKGGTRCFYCHGTGLFRHFWLTEYGGRDDISAGLDLPVTKWSQSGRHLGRFASRLDSGVIVDATWLFETPVGWRVFDDGMKLKLEEAWYDGVGCIVRVMTVDETEYDIDLAKFLMSNLHSGEQRNIRRVNAQGQDAMEPPDIDDEAAPGAGAGGVSPASASPFSAHKAASAHPDDVLPYFDDSPTWLFEDWRGRWGAYDDGTTDLLEAAWRSNPEGFVIIKGPLFEYSVDLAEMVQENSKTGSQSKMRRLAVPRHAPEDESPGPDGLSGTAYEGGDKACWVCKGNGTISKWLSGFESTVGGSARQSIKLEAAKQIAEVTAQHGGAAAIPAGGTADAAATADDGDGGGVENEVLEEEEEEEDNLCPICYTNSAKYGLSTECNHMFCEGRSIVC